MSARARACVCECTHVCECAAEGLSEFLTSLSDRAARELCRRGVRGPAAANAPTELLSENHGYVFINVLP